MKYIRITLIGLALAVSIGAASAIDKSRAEDSHERTSCQRCGDGICARSCENERTCPQDCAPQPSR
jgi:hypothetical protein